MQEQNKTIEDLKNKTVASSELLSLPEQPNPSPSAPTALLNTVVERVEKIENNINSHLLLCRGPSVASKIASSTVNGTPDLAKLKAELCMEICGQSVTGISVVSLGLSLFGKNRNVLKIECSNVNVRNFILKQARSRKPKGIYVVEFLSSN